MIKLIKNISIALLLLSSFEGNSAHIVGGDANYTFVSYNSDSTRITLRFEFNMYRDEFSGGADFDNTAEFGVFRETTGGNWVNIDIRNISPGRVSNIPSLDNPCIQEPSDVGTEATSYTFEYTFDVINTSYQVAYQRCCRNNSITNIVNPGDTGAAFNVTISPEAQRIGNSSPRFNDFPPLFLCANEAFTFDDSATDPDGDVIRYSFCAPSEAGGTVDAMTGNLGCCDCVRPDATRCSPPFGDVQFAPPFTSVSPIGGNPVVTINNITGIISGAPNVVGQFVVGVCAEEYRDGVLIGTIQRDFQFNITSCVSNVVAEFDYEIIAPTNPNDDCKNFRINSCGENVVTILNNSSIPEEIFSYHWLFYNPDGSILEEIAGGPEVRDVEITFPGLGQYQGNMVLNEGTECSDEACFFVNIFPDISADFTFDYDTCVAGPVTFLNQSLSGAIGGITDYEWDFGDGTSSTLRDPTHKFETPGTKNVSLTVIDRNECIAEIDIRLDYFPVPQLIVVEPSSFVGCLPSDVFFENLSSPIDETYDIKWDFGDGGESSEISPIHSYTEAGGYNIGLEITSPLGCTISETFNSFITILESPEADFSFSPDEPNNFTEAVSFTDASTNASSWQWVFGDVGSSLAQNPIYPFPDTGVYRVVLTVFHPITSCPDSISKLVDISPLTTLYMPNAFTPNNDGSNDIFKGKGFFQAISNYELNVFNRWGQMIFTSQDPNEGWNGQFENTGAISPLGVYVYKASFIDPRGEQKVVEGHVTLIR